MEGKKNNKEQHHHWNTLVHCIIWTWCPASILATFHSLLSTYFNHLLKSYSRLPSHLEISLFPFKLKRNSESLTIGTHQNGGMRIQYSSNNVLKLMITPQKIPSPQKISWHSKLNFKGEKDNTQRKPIFYSVKVFCCIIHNYEDCNKWQLHAISF